MAKILLLLISATLAGVLAEPPVPNSYLPPSHNGAQTPDSQNGAPIIANRAHSNQYGAPEFGGISSSQYGAAAALPRSFGGVVGGMSRFGASGSSRSFNGALSARYGAPSATSRFSGDSTRFAGAPSTQYGGVPSTSGRSFDGVIPTQYGTPAVSSGSFDNGLSTQYGASSNQYGAPSDFSRTSALSTQYGVPGANSIYSASGGYAATARDLARENDLAEPANYEFSYDVEDAESGVAIFQEEARQDEQAQGAYRVLLPDGRLQIVEYEADVEGYRPRIRYEDTSAGGYTRGGPKRRGGLEGPY